MDDDNGDCVAKNYAEAVKWYRKAAEQGLADAQNNLGRCYFLGDGVPKDYVEGYKWLLLAVAQNLEGAKKVKPLVEGEMSREQIARGQKLAREFQRRKE